MRKTLSKSASVRVLGVPFLPMRAAEAHRCLTRLCEGSSAAKVFTPNAELLLRADRSPSFRALLCSADLLLPDGAGVLLGARVLGQHLPERITGIDTGEWLLSLAAQRGLRVFLLGGAEGVAEKAAITLTRRFSGLRICGTHHGYFDKDLSSDEDRQVSALIRESAPQILLVCLGSPAQEQWIDAHKDAFPTLRVAMGLGGALDVWSGRVRRAPNAVQRLRLEWLWRGLQDPKRIPRLFAIPQFTWKVCTHAISEKFRKHSK